MVEIGQLRSRVRVKRALPPPATRRALRIAARISLTEVAQTVGVTRQCVSPWELGVRTPQGDNLERYARVLAMLAKELGGA
jgi:transcriptional regulator with XRE-family HTH domain